MFFFGYYIKLYYNKSRSDKKERNYITFLTEMAEKTQDNEQKALLVKKAKELEEGKDEDYLKINEKDEGIYLSDD